MQRLPIQNHPKLPMKSYRTCFVKKTSMQNSVENFGYIKCYSSSSPWSIKSTFFQLKLSGFAVDQEGLETSFSKILQTTERWLTGVVFSCRSLPKILIWRGYRWDLPAIWKTGFVQTHRVQLVCMKVQTCSSPELPSE